VIRLGLRRFAPFSLPPLAIIDQTKACPAVAGLLFSCVIVPYKSKLLTGRCHTKKAHNFRCALLFGRDSVGIRQNHGFSGEIL
jgi:hypothetical protein